MNRGAGTALGSPTSTGTPPPAPVSDRPLNAQGRAVALPLSSAGGRWVLAVTVLGSSATMLAATSVNLALPSLAADLGADSSQQQWVVNAYLLAMASFILLGGSLGDHYGRVAVYRHSRRRPGVGCRCLVRAGCGRPRHRPRDRGLLVTMSRRLVYVVNIFLVVAVAVFSSRVPETRDPRARGEPIDFSGAAATVVLLGCSSYLLINASDLAFGVREYAVLAAVVVAAAAAAAAAVVVLWHIEPNRPHAMVPSTSLLIVGSSPPTWSRFFFTPVWA